MKPLEAWGIISQCMDELIRMRHATWNGGKYWSYIENQAQVITFEALRMMEEDGDAVPREKYDRLKENAEILAKACADKEYVVRCKDCIHNGSYDTDCPITWSGKEYCNFGERGDVDDEKD